MRGQIFTTPGYGETLYNISAYGASVVPDVRQKVSPGKCKTAYFAGCLTCYRLPLNTISDAGQQLSDISIYHHLHLTHWMSQLAYAKPDTEAFDPRKSEYHKQEFTTYCDQVKREWDRYKHKNRVVAYGGL